VPGANLSTVPSVGIGVRTLLILCSATTLLGCAACRSSSPPPAPDDPPADMMGIPEALLHKCTRVAALRSACPTKMPQLTEQAHRAKAFRTGRSSVFYVEWSGPYPGITRRNAPPRFAHINVIASPVDHPLAFDWPAQMITEIEELANAQEKRDEPLLLGAYTWGGKSGEVALAPSFPAGGIEGDHLIFRWIETETAYSISLHAWKPLVESLNDLKAVVESVPI
jgi:hypothetical protein